MGSTGETGSDKNKKRKGRQRKRRVRGRGGGLFPCFILEENAYEGRVEGREGGGKGLKEVGRVMKERK